MTLIEGYPSQYESWLTLKNGSEVFLRPILRIDGHLLVDLFNKMAPQSVYFRFLRHFRALPEEMLHQFTHIDYDSKFALVAMIQEDGKDAIIGVGRYAYDPHENLTDFGVAVRDDWQQLGLGRALLVKIFAIAKEHGISRFVTMMDAQNNIMRKILSDLGYDVKYSLRSGFFQVEIVV